MVIINLKPTEYDKWDKFVDISPQGNICCKTWYLKSYIEDFDIITVQENNKIQGGIVIIKNEVGLFTNPLFSKHLGVLFAAIIGNSYKVETKKRNIIKALLPILNKYKTFNYTFSPYFKTYLPFFWNNYSCTLHYTYHINLKTNSQETIFNNFYSKLKSEIKVAQSCNFEIVENIPFKEFYRVLNATFKRQGGKAPWSISRLESFFKNLKNKKAVTLNGIFSENKKLMAVNGLVYDKKSCALMFNGIDNNTIERGANELLLYNSIINQIGKSDIFDFEGSMIEPIEAFYRKFGGEPISFFRIYRNNIFNYLYPKLKLTYRKLRYNK